jgi:peptidylprolyl isomerase
MTVQVGSKVKVEYKGLLTDGTLFDQSGEGTPIDFVVGEKRLIAGFENGVVGMAEGDTKTLNIPAAEAYGPWDQDLLKKIAKTSIPADFQAVKGMTVKLHLPNGSAVPALIHDIIDDGIIVDLNHPLAGKDLVFEVKVVEIC